MALGGPDFYDQEEVLATYSAMRARPFNAVDTLEKPVFDELAGGLAGLRILDLGCGDASFGQEALEAGCASYLGIEGSQRMIDLAREKLTGSRGRLILARMEDWIFPAQQFDLVSSRLALHYLEDLDSLLSGVYRTLVDGGRFVCSVEHPVITASDRSQVAGRPRQDWIVDDYFESGERTTNWMGGKVVKYHRTLEEYFQALRSAGFTVDMLRESRPRRESFADDETYRRRKRIPRLLFFSASRPAHG